MTRHGTMYCNWELERRPLDEFYEDADHGWLHFKNVGEIHTTVGETFKIQHIPALFVQMKADIQVDLLNVVPDLETRVREELGPQTLERMQRGEA